MVQRKGFVDPRMFSCCDGNVAVTGDTTKLNWTKTECYGSSCILYVTSIQSCNWSHVLVLATSSLISLAISGIPNSNTEFKMTQFLSSSIKCVAALPGVTIKFNIQATVINFNGVWSQQEVSLLVSVERWFTMFDWESPPLKKLKCTALLSLHKWRQNKETIFVGLFRLAGT